MAKEVDTKGKMSNTGEIEDIKKIRDILFGSNMSEYERRFEILEQKLSKSLEEARLDNEKRLQLLEDYVKQELQALQEKLETEKESRLKNERRTSEDIKTIEEQAQSFADKTAKDFSETRNQILELGKSMGEKMNSQNKNLTEKIIEVDSNLQSNKVDRTALAMMFTEIAAQLSGQEEGKSE
jgi:hypothetical protein